jgi:hypothetical protein
MHRKHTLPSYAGIALGLLLLANTSARADLLQWGYNWEPSTMKVSADAGGSGYLSLTDEPANSATGSSNTVVTNIHSFSTASSTAPDTFKNAAITYTLQLEDNTSKTTGSVSFSGYYSGTITANSSNIQLTITSPTTESVTLGGNTYSVALGTYTPPGPPGASNAGSLNAFVTVTAGSGGGTISSVPEPGSLMLAGLALPFVSLAGWRKRRGRKPIAA